jgi:hypothetical protein
LPVSECKGGEDLALSPTGLLFFESAASWGRLNVMGLTFLFRGKNLALLHGAMPGKVVISSLRLCDPARQSPDFEVMMGSFLPRSKFSNPIGLSKSETTRLSVTNITAAFRKIKLIFRVSSDAPHRQHRAALKNRQEM